MSNSQPGILGPVPRLARHLFFRLGPGAEIRNSLQTLPDLADGDGTVIGLGESLVLAIGKSVDGLRTFPQHTGPGFAVPSTPFAVWFWLRGDDRGDLLHRTRVITNRLAPAFQLDRAIDAFMYGPSLDLTGYEDGTENPKGAKAEETAIVSHEGPGLDGGSFVAVQQWIHDLDYFDSLGEKDRDLIIGRRKSDNREIEDAPPSAHVKRTAQEAFSPEAFIVRRSMPWADEKQAGLVFVAFGKSFDAFEALLNRMVGKEDGVADALFRFTRPISGGYYWCPPVQSGRLDLSAIGR